MEIYKLLLLSLSLLYIRQAIVFACLYQILIFVIHFLNLKHSNPSILVNQRPTSGCDICGAVKHHCNVSDITS